MAAGGKNSSQARSRVSRVPARAKPKTDPGPVTSKADLTENIRRGAGPTRAGSNTPVSVKGPASSSVRPAGPAIRDMSHSATGMTIAQRANSRMPGGKGRGQG
jgi:hypothetical protein